MPTGQACTRAYCSHGNLLPFGAALQTPLTTSKIFKYALENNNIICSIIKIFQGHLIFIGLPIVYSLLHNRSVQYCSSYIIKLQYKC